MRTKVYNPSYDKQKIVDNCKYLFGDDIDPVVPMEPQYDEIVEEQEQSDNGYSYSYRSVQKTYTYWAMVNLRQLTTELTKDRVAQEVLHNKLKEGVEEKLKCVTAGTDLDDIFKEGLRQQLYQRARASFKRKQEKRKNEIARKMQDMLDTLDDEDEDDDEASMDQILLRVQRPSKNTTSQNNIDWCGEHVSNMIKDCQMKFREELKQQKELTKKFEEIEIAIQKAKDVANQKLLGVQLEHEGVKKIYDETIEGMKQDHAHSNAEKEAFTRDLKEELGAKVQALEKACSSVEKEKGFRKKPEDALDVLHETEMERKQGLAEFKAELQRNLH
ncbi:hypothetical protein FPQ18DRAFT_411477 [Pyronema domesticum]|nr:hypothetical protein FPQ18DRAFT_411477 [Pyronema domesticum]